MKTLLLLLSLIFVSCSSSTKPTVPLHTEVIPNIDRTGEMFQLGGTLFTPDSALHVTHWPVKIGQVVKFRRKDGDWSHVKVIKKEVIEGDLCRLYFDKELDMKQHTILPIAPAMPGPVTTGRLDGELVGFSFEGRRHDDYGDYVVRRIKIKTSDDHKLISGDSGKRWVQVHRGEHVVVGFNSTSKGWSPDVWEILK